MSDRQPMQAAGQDGDEGQTDGVSDAPAKQGGGESGGGAYPNPQSGKAKGTGGFFGHGGQTEIDYSGTGGKADPDTDNPNAVTKD